MNRKEQPMREHTTTKQRDIDYIDTQTDILLQNPFQTLSDCYENCSVYKEIAMYNCLARVKTFCETEGIKWESPSVVFGITAHNCQAFTFTCITPKGAWVETAHNIYFYPDIRLDKGDEWEAEKND